MISKNTSNKYLIEVKHMMCCTNKGVNPGGMGGMYPPPMF